MKGLQAHQVTAQKSDQNSGYNDVKNDLDRLNIDNYYFNKIKK